MNARGFTSSLAPQLEAYLAFKKRMGFYGASRIWYLKQFDAYCAAHERTVFDRDTVEGWVSQQLTRSGRYRSWMSYIRCRLQVESGLQVEDLRGHRRPGLAAGRRVGWSGRRS